MLSFLLVIGLTVGFFVLYKIGFGEDDEDLSQGQIRAAGRFAAFH